MEFNIKSVLSAGEVLFQQGCCCCCCYSVTCFSSSLLTDRHHFILFFATFLLSLNAVLIHSTIEVKRAVSLDALTYSLDGKVKCAFFCFCFTLNSSLPPPKGGGQVATLLLFGVLPLARCFSIVLLLVREKLQQKLMMAYSRRKTFEGFYSGLYFVCSLFKHHPT